MSIVPATDSQTATPTSSSGQDLDAPRRDRSRVAEARMTDYDGGLQLLQHPDNQRSEPLPETTMTFEEGDTLCGFMDPEVEGAAEDFLGALSEYFEGCHRNFGAALDTLADFLYEGSGRGADPGIDLTWLLNKIAGIAIKQLTTQIRASLGPVGALGGAVISLAQAAVQEAASRGVRAVAGPGGPSASAETDRAIASLASLRSTAAERATCMSQVLADPAATDYLMGAISSASDQCAAMDAIRAASSSANLVAPSVNTYEQSLCREWITMHFERRFDWYEGVVHVHYEVDEDGVVTLEDARIACPRAAQLIQAMEHAGIDSIRPYDFEAMRLVTVEYEEWPSLSNRDRMEPGDSDWRHLLGRTYGPLVVEELERSVPLRRFEATDRVTP